MAEQTYINFIEEIIERTKAHSISWDYLDKKIDLYQGMDWTRTKTQIDIFYGTKESEYVDFNVENSFYAKIDNTYIVLKVRNNNPADLFVIPYTFKKVVKMSADEYGEYITRLMNIVQSQFPDAKDFISNFLHNEE